MTASTTDTHTVTQPRSVERVVAGQPTSDGAGVKLTRVLTQPLQRRGGLARARAETAAFSGPDMPRRRHRLSTDCAHPR